MIASFRDGAICVLAVIFLVLHGSLPLLVLRRQARRRGPVHDGLRVRPRTAPPPLDSAHRW